MRHQSGLSENSCRFVFDMSRLPEVQLLKYSTNLNIPQNHLGVDSSCPTWDVDAPSQPQRMYSVGQINSIFLFLVYMTPINCSIINSYFMTAWAMGPYLSPDKSLLFHSMEGHQFIPGDCLTWTNELPSAGWGSLLLLSWTLYCMKEGSTSRLLLEKE